MCTFFSGWGRNRVARGWKKFLFGPGPTHVVEWVYNGHVRAKNTLLSCGLTPAWVLPLSLTSGTRVTRSIVPSVIYASEINFQTIHLDPRLFHDQKFFKFGSVFMIKTFNVSFQILNCETKPNRTDTGGLRKIFF